MIQNAQKRAVNAVKSEMYIMDRSTNKELANSIPIE